MAARGDMYMEVDKPDMIIDGCEDVIRADPDAVFASRILTSTTDVDKIPKCSDLFDLYCGMKMGYKRFLMGDEVCTRETSLKSAVNLFGIISQKHDYYNKKHI